MRTKDKLRSRLSKRVAEIEESKKRSKKEREEENKKLLEKALNGLKILYSILTEMLELKKYSYHRNIRIAKWESHEIIVREGKLYYTYLPLGLSMFSLDDYKILDEKAIKELIYKKYPHLSGLRRDLAMQISNVNEQKKEKIIRRTLKRIVW